MKLLIMSSCHSQIHGPGKVMVTKVAEAFGPSNIYCLSPTGACMAMINGWNHHPWGYPLWGAPQTVKPEGLLG